MAAIALTYPHALTFRPFQPWLWLRCAALTLGSFGFALLGLLAHDMRWLLPIAPCALLIVLQIARYHAHEIRISGASLICRRGLLRVRVATIAATRLDFEVRQSLLGRLCDYGNVRISTRRGQIEVPQIAGIRMLREVIAERQTEVYLAMHRIDRA